MGESWLEGHRATGTTGMLENTQEKGQCKWEKKPEHKPPPKTQNSGDSEKWPFLRSILGASNPFRSRREKWPKRRNRAPFCKGKGKIFPTYRSQGEWRALRRPKSFLLFIYMYEYFVVSSGRKQFSNCTCRLFLLNRCSLILFNREIILFNYNPICKQRILGTLGAEMESGGCDVCIFSIQAHRLWNLCEKAFFSCKWHRKKKKKKESDSFVPICSLRDFKKAFSG